jgi:hypothetical protein
MSGYPLPGLGNGRRFALLALKGDLLSEAGKMSGKNLQELHGGFVLGSRDHARIEVGLFHLFEINMGAPSKQGLRQPAEFRFRWMVNKNLSGFQPRNEILSHANRHRRFAEARKAFKCFRLDAGLSLDLSLHGQTSLAGDIRSRHEAAKRRRTLSGF